MKFHIFIVLLAGGTGTRMGSPLPKQFHTIKGKTLIEYSVETFLNWKKQSLFQGDVIFHENLFLVLPEDYISYARSLYNGYPLEFIEGGENRHDSSRNALKKIREIIPKSVLPDEILVFFHDVARPLFYTEDLDAMIEKMRENLHLGAISIVAPVPETLLKKENDGFTVLDRNFVFTVKTPQVLRGNYLDSFFTVPYKEKYTDLLTWCIDQDVNFDVVISKKWNVKLTYNEDLTLLECLLEKRNF